MARVWTSRLVAALGGALLGLVASSPGLMIDLKNWTAWLGARLVTAAFPTLSF